MAHRMNGWWGQVPLYPSRSAYAAVPQLHMPHGISHTGDGWGQWGHGWILWGVLLGT